MITLFDVKGDAKIGEITQEQLQFLIDQLVEEHDEDQDYYINPSTLDMFEEASGDAGLISMLRDALGDREDMDIRWEEA